MEFITQVLLWAVLLAILVGAAFVITFLWLVMFGGGASYNSPNNATRSDNNSDSQMNEGDYHSGPEGYSPNTAYPDTQYGSGFDGYDEDEFNR